MIRKVKGGYELVAKKKNPKTGKRRILGHGKTRASMMKREHQVEYFKNHG